MSTPRIVALGSTSERSARQPGGSDGYEKGSSFSRTNFASRSFPSSRINQPSAGVSDPSKNEKPDELSHTKGGERREPGKSRRKPDRAKPALPESSAADADPPPDELSHSKGGKRRTSGKSFRRRLKRFVRSNRVADESSSPMSDSPPEVGEMGAWDNDQQDAREDRLEVLERADDALSPDAASRTERSGSTNSADERPPPLPGEHERGYEGIGDRPSSIDRMRDSPGMPREGADNDRLQRTSDIGLLTKNPASRTKIDARASALAADAEADRVLRPAVHRGLVSAGVPDPEAELITELILPGFIKALDWNSIPGFEVRQVPQVLRLAMQAFAFGNYLGTLVLEAAARLRIDTACSVPRPNEENGLKGLCGGNNAIPCAVH